MHVNAVPMFVRFKNNRRNDIDSNASDGISENRPIHFTNFHCAECVCYLLFMVIFICMALGSRSWSDDVYFSSKAVTDRCIGFSHVRLSNDINETITWNSIIDADHVWYFLEHVLVPTLMVSDEDVYHQHAILMGGIRMRQYRVAPRTCKYKNTQFHCSSSDESKDTMSLSSSNLQIHWTSASQNHEAPYFHGMQGVYPGSGFVVILPANKTQASDLLLSLKNHLFIDAHTRFLSLDFNQFHPNTGMHTISRLVFEFGKTGDVDSSAVIQTWRLLRYENNEIAFGFDIAFGVCVLLATITEIKEICTTAWKEYIGFWNLLDWVNILSNWCIVLMLVLQWKQANDIDLLSTQQYTSLLYIEYLIFIQNYFEFLSGMLLFIRLFKYFQFSTRLSFVFHMIGFAAIDILIFIFVIAIFIGAFGFAGYIVFNAEVLEFRSLLYSVGNMARATISGLDYDSLVGQTTVSNWIFASVYYVIWGVLVILILANVFIAILSEAYSNVQRKAHQKHITVKQLLVDAIDDVGKEANAVTHKIKNALQRRADDTLSKDALAKMMQKFTSTNRVSRGVILETVLEMDGESSKNKTETQSDTIRKSLQLLYADDVKVDRDASVSTAPELSDSQNKGYVVIAPEMEEIHDSQSSSRSMSIHVSSSTYYEESNQSIDTKDSLRLKSD
eukprot:928412_1